jgi:hypothetical protein
MPQISLYIDKHTLLKIEKAARQQRVSISKWVGNSIKTIIADDYPEGYLSLFGAVKDDSFHRPASRTIDTPREPL